MLTVPALVRLQDLGLGNGRALANERWRAAKLLLVQVGARTEGTMELIVSAVWLLA